MDKQKTEKLFVSSIVFGLLALTLIFAYPVLDSGIVGSLQEDQSPAYTYNFTQNVTGSITGNLIFSIYSINSTLYNFTSPSSYPWISIGPSTGVITLNSTRNNETGSFNISITVIDDSSQGTTVVSIFNVTTVNDAPQFANLENKSFNISELFSYTVNVTDEENNIPFTINISFLNCSVSAWSTRNCSNSSGRELFNSSYYTFNSTSGVLNISFTPEKNDVGSYTINFSVIDNSSLGNQTTSQIVNFTVLNVNSAPYFRYVCDNERNATEDYELTCWINASDTDETYNLTFSSNYTWFTFYNNSNRVVSLTVACNSSTSYNSSALVNFTANDSMVGNWSINLTVTDIGSGLYSPKANSTVFWFFINNTEDIVSLNEISNYTAYENLTIYVNATDNDLLVPDKTVKNEILAFASNTSWVNISSYSSSGNYTTAKIQVNYDSALLLGAGNYTIKVNVTDTAGNTAERNFTISVLGDNVAVWNISMTDVFVIYENNVSYWNFSQNVTDADGDSINFSFTNTSAFSSFSINITTGIINFTPVDGDVGYHNITINASDGKKDSLKSFNFTVLNVNDNPVVETALTAINATAEANSNINCSEDNLTTITLWAQDEDFKIPSNQKNFYNETLNVSVNITGINASLFTFSKTSSFPTASFPNRTEYTAVFTPRKADVGSYNITINITDLSNSSTTLTFNLTVFSIGHAPVLMALTNQTSSIDTNFYYRINATDTEDGNSTTSGNNNFTFAYSFLSGTILFNSTTFNITKGEINITFNSTQGGKYHINITVNDSGGSTDTDNFWIYVYDVPNVTFPSSTYQFNLAENTTTNLTFRANHSVGDNLTFKVYVQNTNYSNVLKYNLSYYGNSTNLTWQFTPNFTEETQGIKNLTLLVLNPAYPNLNLTSVWNVTINHTNSPVVFSGHIGDSQATYSSVITINLLNYFSDIDYSDSYYNQTVSFNTSSNSTSSSITSTFSNWTLTLSSSAAVTELLNITAVDSNGTNATSNNFEIEFTTPATTTTTSGGGGGGGGITPVAFKIIAPGKVSAYAQETIIIPISLDNTGDRSFKDISLFVVGYKNGDIADKVKVSLADSYFARLDKNSVKNTSLTVFFDTNKIGDYEILINATSKSPKYTDWAKIYINLQNINESDVRELLIFTEELIAKNPECVEITEILDEAKGLFENGDHYNAKIRAQEAVNACKESINQSSLSRTITSNFIRSLNPAFYPFAIVFIGIALAIIIGLAFYFWKRKNLVRIRTGGGEFD